MVVIHSNSNGAIRSKILSGQLAGDRNVWYDADKQSTIQLTGRAGCRNQYEYP